MQVLPEEYETASDVGKAVAATVCDLIKGSAGRRFLLGCPGGRSLAPAYEALASLVAEDDLDLSNVVVVMMDDYVVIDDAEQFVRVDSSLMHSCERFGRMSIFEPLNLAAAPGKRMAEDALWLPDPADPEAFDAKIRENGGIDLFLLASGTSDGHIAFNPPGSLRSSKTRIVQLAETTRRDNLGTFPDFGDDLANVPSLGVSVGIETIRELSTSVLMVCTGRDKAAAVARIQAAIEYEADWPATILSECDNARFFVDRDAASATQVPQLDSSLSS
jgi:glucosamine-6-phosphate deaminase